MTGVRIPQALEQARPAPQVRILSVDDVLGGIAQYTRDPVLARAAGRLRGQSKETATEALRNLRNQIDPFSLKAALDSLERL